MKIKTLLLFALIPLCSFATKKDFGYTENKGQIHDQDGNARPDVLFIHEANGLKVILRENGFSYELVRTEVEETELSDDPMMKAFQDPSAITQYIHRIDIEWLGANSNIEVSREGPSPDYLNFYQGQLKAEMVRGFQQVTYHEVWPGVDIVFKMEDGRPKYDIVLQAGADLSQVQLKYLGADGLELKDDALLMQTSQGVLTEDVPASFNGTGKMIEVSMNLTGNVLAFAGSTDKGLIIDPVPYRKWTTYYGGSGVEAFNDVLVVENIGVVAAGNSNSYGLASSGAYQDTIFFASDALIVMFDHLGSRLWATYFGGGHLENIWNISSRPISQSVLFAMSTKSFGLPVSLGAHQDECNCLVESDMYFGELDTSGFWLGGSYFGGSGWEGGNTSLKAYDVDHYYFHGSTTSTDSIATPGAYQESINGTGDAFAGVFNSDWSLEWATYYGGSEGDAFWGSCYSNGVISLVGHSRSFNFPTTIDAVQQNKIGDYDAVITKLDTNGNLLYSTYFGGGGQSNERLWCCIADEEGTITAFGNTDSPGLGTPGTAFENLAGGLLGFMIQLDSANNLNWVTYTPEEALGIDLYENEIYCFGEHESGGAIYTTSNAFQPNYGGGPSDQFISKYSYNGAQHLFGSYLGGNNEDKAGNIAIGPDGAVYFTGRTESTGLAFGNAYQNAIAGLTDALLTKLEQSTISVDPFSGGPFCGGDQISAAYQASGEFPPNPTFELFLFSDPDSLQNGYVLGSNIGVSGTISGTIPQYVKSDSTYRLTVRNVDYDFFDEDNGSDLIIYGDGQAALWLGPGLCLDLAPVDLDEIVPGGTPDGGFYTGNGVDGNNIFTPSIAGVGSHQIIYTYTDPAGCFTDTASQSFYVEQPVPAQILGPDSLCVNGPLFLLEDATPLDGFWWGDDVFLQEIDPGLAGLGPTTVYYGYISLAICSDTTSHDIWIIPEKDTVTISISGADLVSSEPYGNQWYRNNNPLAGATDQIYAPVSNGDYHVATNYYGCTLYSDTLTLTEVGIEELGQTAHVSILPNPSNGQFLFSATGLEGSEVELLIVDVLGAVVYRKELRTNNGAVQEQIDLSEFSTGSYFLHVRSGEQMLTKKILLER